MQNNAVEIYTDYFTEVGFRKFITVTNREKFPPPITQSFDFVMKSGEFDSTYCANYLCENKDQ